MSRNVKTYLVLRINVISQRTIYCGTNCWYHSRREYSPCFTFKSNTKRGLNDGYSVRTVDTFTPLGHIIDPHVIIHHCCMQAFRGKSIPMLYHVIVSTVEIIQYYGGP